MTAETLRRAASLMRERATDARAGVWTALPSVLEPDTTLVLADWEHDRRRVATASGSLPEGNAANAEHIASWHPAVALAVANWLEATADDWDRSTSPIPVSDCRIDARAALNMARAYLGEVDQ